MADPALTAEDWATYPNFDNSWYSDEGRAPLYYPTRHGIAAANLHGQPFGFTREDVECLRELAKHYNDDADNYETTGPAAVWLSALADRIEALLPPDDPKPLTGKLHR